MPNTLNYNWNIPTVGADLDVWGDENNAAWMLCDAEMFLKANKNAPTLIGPVTVQGNLAVTGQATLNSCIVNANMNVTGPFSAGSLNTPGDLTVTGNATITGNLTVGGTVSFTSISTPGDVTAKTFIGNPSAILRPVLNGPGAVQLQSSTGTGLFLLNTTTGAISIFGPIIASSGVQLRPTVDGANAFQFQNVAGAAIVSLNTTTGLLTSTGGITATGTVTAGTITAAAGTINGDFSVFGNAGVTGNLAAGVFKGQTAAMIRPATDSASAIQFQTAAGTAVMIVSTNPFGATIAGLTQIKLDATRQLYLVSAGDPVNKQMRLGFDVSNNTSVVESLLNGAGIPLLLNPTGGNVGVGTTTAAARLHVVGTGAAPTLSADAEVFYVSATTTVGLAIGALGAAPWSAWMQVKRTDNGGIADNLSIQPMGGSVGIGTASPISHLHVDGAGAGEAGAFTPSSNVMNSLFINDSTGGFNSGGALILGSANRQFAAIRAEFHDPTSFGIGNLSIMLRLATGTGALTPVMTFHEPGGVSLQTLQSTNPGAGSKRLWYDPADGNRVKYGA